LPLSLTLPRLNAYMTTAVIRAVYVREGERVTPGAKLLDLSVDLSASAPHDCPAISYYRIASRDRGWVRSVAVAPGDERAVGDELLALAGDSSERPARTTIAGILYQPDWP